MLGFALGGHHDAQLAYSALVMAVAVRGGQVADVIMLTDQGASTPLAWSSVPASGCPSPSRWAGPGRALGNVVIESWHPAFESGLLRAGHFATRAAAQAGVAAWIEDHNHHRRHSAPGRISPVDYKRSLAGEDAA